MLTKKTKDGRNQVEFNCLEELVPKNHLLRKIENAINFNFIYDEVAELYSAQTVDKMDIFITKISILSTV